MPQTPRWPGLYAIQADYTESVSGCGRQKYDDKPPSRLDVNCTGPEYSQIVVELIATQKSIGKTLTGLPGYGEDELGSMREAIERMIPATNRCGFVEHFINRTAAGLASIYVAEINTASSAVAMTDHLGVRQITLGAATIEGWEAPDDLFYQRAFHGVWLWDMSALPGTDTDYFEVGIEYSVTPSFVRFRSERAGGSWPDWTIEVDNGVSSDSDTLTGFAPDTAWHVFEIFTTDTTSTFWIDRGTAGQVKGELTGAAPEDAIGSPIIRAYSAVGGEDHNTDLIACFDTRTF